MCHVNVLTLIKSVLWFLDSWHMTVNRIHFMSVHVQTKVIMVTNSNYEYFFPLSIIIIALKEMSIADNMIQFTVFVCC